MILVTGGAGYIGSHTVISLLEEGYDVVILDSLVNSYQTVIDKVESISNKKVTFYKGDICDTSLLRTIFGKHEIQHVIHFAGLKSVGESIKEPLKYYTVNISGTLNVVSEMIRAGVNNLIFSSSATVYGQPESIPLTENCRTGGTINPYGTSKYYSECILNDIAKAHPSMNITLLRYFNPVGAHTSGLIGESPRGIPNNLVPYLMKVAGKELECLSVFGNDYQTKDGTGVRDYIHVMDLAEGHVAALKHNNKGLKVYNLGTGNGYSVLELIAAFEESTGIKINYNFCPRREGDVAECWSDPRLAENEINWKAKRTLKDMVCDAWYWQQQSSKESAS